MRNYYLTFSIFLLFTSLLPLIIESQPCSEICMYYPTQHKYFSFLLQYPKVSVICVINSTHKSILSLFTSIALRQASPGLRLSQELLC